MHDDDRRESCWTAMIIQQCVTCSCCSTPPYVIHQSLPGKLPNVPGAIKVPDAINCIPTPPQLKAISPRVSSVIQMPHGQQGHHTIHGS
jgi:hypothetical protein